MSDITESVNQAQQHAGSRVCKVSYILNNAQPVQCTIIGDQPLFYMDYGCGIDDEDDGMFDAADLSILENEIESLKKEIGDYDLRMSPKEAPSPDQSYLDYLEDKQSLNTNAQFTKSSAEEIVKAIDKSRIGRTYLEFAAQHNVEIKMSAQVQDAEYERKQGVIYINSGLEFSDQVLLAARELRRHWQHRQGALIHPLLFHPDNAILVNRAQSADLTVAMIRLGWELQLGGFKGPWERIGNSSMADLARAFAREAYLDFRTFNNGQAGAAVFEAWFLSERCRHEDKKLIKQMLADYQGYVFDGEEAGKALTPALISALGEMPFGKNYLSAHAQTIVSDPIFTEVRDRSNANFLWFIKFERSFRDAEQELQSNPGCDFNHAAQESSSSGASSKTLKREFTYDKETGAFGHARLSAEIVRLFPDETESAGDKTAGNKKILPPKAPVKRRKNKQPSAEIVYLKR